MLIHQCTYSFLLPLLSDHVSRNPTTTSPPFFLGVSGPQGSGKTSLVTILAANLRATPHKLNVVVFSIDDIYRWCVGFRPLSDEELKQKWENSRQAQKGTLGRHALEHLQFINTKLKDYDSLTNSLDALIHIDAEDTAFVYDWRIQQEHGLFASHGSGMTDDQVIDFVDGYMPAYELYVDTLRRGALKEKGKQLRVVIGKDRNTSKVVNL